MKLTEQKIKALKGKAKGYKVTDGGGLFLFVASTGKKYWRIKYYFNNKEKAISVGEYPYISLQEARVELHKIKEGLIKGHDVLAEQEKEKEIEVAIIEEEVLAAVTFKEVCSEWLNQKQSTWVKGHYVKQICRIEKHIYPIFQNRPIREISTREILEHLRKLENADKIETAHRIRSIISQVFKYAIICDLCDSDPCRDLSGALKPAKVTPRAAIIEQKEVGKLMAKINSYPSKVLRNAMLFSAYTLCRPGEIRQAEWSEINFEKREWNIPAEKMKMSRSHRVPLSTQCIELLKELEGLHKKWVFPSKWNGKCISDSAVLLSLRKMGYSKEDMCAHGFRAMGSTLLNECNYRSDLIEKSLAHSDGDKIRAAYNRAEYFDERREMMQFYADYLDSLGGVGAKPVRLSKFESIAV